MTLPAPARDRTCVVTGASSGIGAEIARQLAARGHGVTLVARREDRLTALADELAKQHGVRAETVAADLVDSTARHRLADEISARGLTAEVLVNNAGFTTMGPVYRSDPTAEVAMIRTNVEAVVELCSLFVPGMVERGRGAILNVASTAAFQPLPGQAGYAASKSFVLSYTQAIRGELRGTRVAATALCPGPVETGFGEVAGLTDDEASTALPRFLWVSVEAVARAAVLGMDDGRAVVIPGAFNRVGAVGAHLMPRRVLVPMLARRHPSLQNLDQP